MATTIVTKYGGDAPAASDIVRGELAVDTENGRLYTENAAGAVVEIGLNPEGNVDVTGTLTADGLTVSPSGTQQVLATLRANSGAGGGLVVQTDASDDGLIRGYDSSGAVQIQFDTDGGDNYIAKGNVGIGTTSPAQPLEILKTSAGAVVPMIQLRNGSSSAGSGTSIKFMHSTVSNATSGTCELESIRYSGNLGALTFKTSNNGGTVTERMRVNDTGVGIGTSSPTGLLHLAADNAHVISKVMASTTGYDAELWLGRNDTRKAIIKAEQLSANSDHDLVFFTNGASADATEKVRITSAGDVSFANSDGIIKAIGGDVSLVQGAVGLRINDAALALSPTTASANNDASVDLGVSNIRFKDLHMSGVATLGGASYDSTKTIAAATVGTT